MTYVSGNNCLFNMHAIIHMPTMLDICENTDKTFDDVFNVNLKYAVIFPIRQRLRTNTNFNTHDQNLSIYSNIVTYVVKTLAP